MSNKSYTVIIQIDFNTLDCPGVWLCPKGKAFLKVCLFGIADLTKDVDPFFPLVIRERFMFEKNFRGVSSVYELHDKIGRSVISIELLQCPVGSPGCVKLAIFNSLLSDLLHPYSSCFAKPPDTSGIELLFTTCKIFPGIIAPKADVALKVVVSDTHGDDGKPTVRRVPLKLRKGDKKRTQSVCHSKNGLNCGCFSRDQPPKEDEPHSDEGGDGVTEPTAHAGRSSAPKPLTDHRSRPSKFYAPPVRKQTSPSAEPSFEGRRGQYRAIESEESRQPSLNSKKKSKLTQEDPQYLQEPDAEWARINLGLAYGPGQYGKDGQRNTLFSSGWEYVWDGKDDNKKDNSRSVLTTRRQRLRGFEENDPKYEVAKEDKYEDNTKGIEDKYGDDAIRRELEECEELLERGETFNMKYNSCKNNIDWLQKYGKSSITGKLMPSTSTEEPLQSTAKQPSTVPCHGLCCKCNDKNDSSGNGQSFETDALRASAAKRGTRPKLSTIDENSEWIPRTKWEKERQRETRHQKERMWERERIVDERERRSQERERRRLEERVRQKVDRERMKREQQERMNKLLRESSSENDESVKSVDVDRGGRLSEVPKKEPPRAERRVIPPEKAPKPSVDTTKPKRPSTTPYDGRMQDERIPAPSSKVKAPQKPKTSEARKPPTVQRRGPRNVRPEEGDSPMEDCDCDLCEEYQELYNPSSHPCPRFRKSGRTTRRTPPRSTGAGARKLVSSRKNGYRPSKKPEPKGGECGFASCDGPIDTEAIDELNEIRKFYYGK